MPRLTSRDWLWLAALTLLALAVRLYRLESVPPGLHHDEAQNGLDAQHLLISGERPIYIGTRFNGEPILQYAIMLSEAALGLTPLAVRFPSALFGALTVPLLYLLALELFQQNGESNPAARTRAVIAAFVLATLYWHVNASREGYKPILVPLFGTLSFLLLLHTFRPNSAPAAGWRAGLWPVATGVVLGLGFYTYPSIRFLYIVVALYVLRVLWRERAQWRRPFARAGVAAVVALIVFAPLAYYYIQHPAAFFTRSDQVAVWATRPDHMGEAIIENAGKVAGMFTVAGDSNPRHNLPERPALDWGLAIGFCLGLWLMLRRITHPAHLLVLLWLLIMLVPSIVTEAAPNFLRVLGAAAPTALLIGAGLGALGDWLARVPRLARLAALPVAALLLVSATLSLDAYFNLMPRDPRTWYAFDVGLVKIGEVVRNLPANERVYLTPFDNDQASIRFTLGGAPRPGFSWFDGRKCLVSPPPDQPATMLVVSEDFRTMGHLQAYWPQGESRPLIDDFAGKPYLSLFHVPAQSWTNTPRNLVGQTFGGQMTLTGYSILSGPIKAGQGIPTVLFWRAQRPMQTAYTVFAQLVGPANPRTGNPLWGQYDSQPCAGGYPTTRWDPAETFVHDFLVVIDKDTPAGSYQVAVGAYDLSTGVRLTLPDGSDHLLIDPIEVTRP